MPLERLPYRVEGGQESAVDASFAVPRDTQRVGVGDRVLHRVDLRAAERHDRREIGRCHVALGRRERVVEEGYLVTVSAEEEESRQLGVNVVHAELGTVLSR